MAWSNLIADIEANIRTNGVGAITGQLLQNVLLEMIGELSSVGSAFNGMVNTTGTYAFNTDGEFFVVTSEDGDYSNIGYNGELKKLTVLNWNPDTSGWVADTTLADDIAGIHTVLQNIDTEIGDLQPKLTQGDGVEIDEHNTISVKDGDHVFVNENGVNVEVAHNIEDEPDKIPIGNAVKDYIASQKNEANGIAGLDENGHVAESVLPDAITMHNENGDIDDSALYRYYRETIGEATQKISSMRVALREVSQSLAQVSQALSDAGYATNLATGAAESANSAAGNARSAAYAATGAAGKASTAAINANAARDAANNAAGNASNKAAAAESAASFANEKAADAESAASLANEKAGLANEKAGDAESAASAANEAAGRAEAAFALIGNLVVHEEDDPNVGDNELYDYYQATVQRAIDAIRDMDAKMAQVDSSLEDVSDAIHGVDEVIGRAEDAISATNSAINNANNAAASVSSARNAAISAANYANAAASNAGNAAADARLAAQQANESVGAYQTYLEHGVLFEINE